MLQGVCFVKLASSDREYTSAFAALKHTKRAQRRLGKYLDLLKTSIWNRN
jgi:hypothetical protein